MKKLAAEAPEEESSEEEGEDDDEEDDDDEEVSLSQFFKTRFPGRPKFQPRRSPDSDSPPS